MFPQRFYTGRFYAARYWAKLGANASATPLTIEESVTAALLASPGVSSLISTRVYCQRRPQNSQLPCVVYRVTSRVPLLTIGGSTVHNGATLQLACMANSMSTARSLKAAVRVAMSDYVGRLGNATSGAIVHVSSDSDESSQRVNRADGSADYVYAEIVGYDLRFREPA